MLEKFWSVIEYNLQIIFDRSPYWDPAPTELIIHFNDTPMLLWNTFWWSFMTGATINFNWTTATPRQNQSLLIWLEWLNANVGRQHIDWTWRYYYDLGVEIKFRRGLETLATKARLSMEDV